MIDITQIRVGNIVYDNLNQRNVSINGIETGHNTVWVDYNNGYGIYPLYVFQLDEIYLSKEVLSQYAFLINSVSNTFRIDLKDRPEVLFLSLKEVGNGKPYIVNLFSFGISKMIKEVRYLHEIQNIVYCLTGFELRDVS